MAYEITAAALTSAQRADVADLQQKIEALNAEIYKLQVARRDAQDEFLKKFVDEWTPKEIALADERNKCFDALKAMRAVTIKAV